MLTDELALKMTSLYFDRTGKFFPSTAMSAGEDRLLAYLYKQKEPVLVGEMSRDLKLSSGRTANLLKQLEKKKCILRIQQSDDKRKFEVSLTDSGRARAESIYSIIMTRCSSLVEAMGTDDAAEFIRLLEKAAGLIRA